MSGKYFPSAKHDAVLRFDFEVLARGVFLREGAVGVGNLVSMDVVAGGMQDKGREDSSSECRRGQAQQGHDQHAHRV
jgi:hypothetical protein